MGDWTTDEGENDEITDVPEEVSEEVADEGPVGNSEEERSFIGEGAPFDPHASQGDYVDEPIGEPNYKLGFIGAFAAALVGGAIWAAVYIVTGYEIGWLAIGLGAATGGVALRMANYGSPQLGMGAGAISVVGLIFAKVLIGTVGVPHLVAEEALGDPELMTELVYIVERDEGRVPPEVQSWYESPAEEFPSAEVGMQVKAFEVELGEKVSNMAESERQEVAKKGAEVIVPSIPFTDRFGLSGYDLLWFGISVYAAFRIGRGEF